jgi:AraC-like DNA-binding protein
MASTDTSVAATDIGRDCWRVTQVRRTGLATYPRGAHLGPKTIHDREFAWIIEGEATITYAGCDWQLRPGDLAIIAPGVVHEFAWSAHKPTRHGYIHFSTTGPAEMCEIDRPVLRGTDASRLCMLLGHLLTLADRATAGETGAGVLLREGLSFVLHAVAIEARSRLSPAGTNRWSHPAIERVMRRLESQCERGVVPNIAVASLARQAGISEGHLNRLIKRRFGHRLSTLLRHMRLNHAVELLDRTDLSVKEIAAACGYDNRFAFSRALKAAIGAAPGQMRTALRAGAPRPAPLPELKLLK